MQSTKEIFELLNLFWKKNKQTKKNDFKNSFLSNKNF